MHDPARINQESDEELHNSQAMQTVEALKASEEKYRKLFMEMIDGFALHEIVCNERGIAVDYITLEVNRTYEVLLDVPRAAVVGKKASLFLSQSELKHWLAIFAPVALTGHSTEYEMYSPINQKYFKGSAYCPEKGKFAVTFVDVTEHKRAEEKLAESEARYRALFDSAGYSISIAKNGVQISGNPAFAKLFGYKDTLELVGTNLMDTIAPQERNRIKKYIVDRAEGKEAPVHYETKGLRRDGTTFDMEVTISTYVFHNELYTVGFQSDITDRKRAEETLQANEVQLSNALEAAHLGPWEYDVVNDLFTFNDHFYKIFRTTVEQVGSYTMHSAEYARRFLHPDDMHLVGKEIQKSLETKDPHFSQQLEHRIRYADGTDGYISVRIFIVKDSYGRTIKTHGVNQDITERKQAEHEQRSLHERLQRAEKMEALGQLAGGVAHDLNNVLGVSTIYSELLQEQVPEGSPLRKYVDNILSSTQKGAAIIEDLLTLARRSVAASAVMNLNSIVSNFLKNAEFEKIQAYHPHVTFTAECQEELLNIKGSPVHLEKTLMNLVSNAGEAISAHGAVTIRTENRYLDKPVRGYDEVKQGDYVVLTVSDTGMGIPADNIGKIFEPFYTKKTMGRSGTGLGLAIVWGTVKDHKGYIDLHSEVGEGTTFTLYFPVTREELAAQRQKVPIEQYLGNDKSVLVVDDIAEQRDVATRLLTRLGYQVHAVSSGEAALEYLREHTADILVLDMIMPPGIDGLETYQRVLEINPQQKAILVSGFSETDRVKKAQELGAGAYVRKPYIMEKIGVAIRDELTR